MEQRQDEKPDLGVRDLAEYYGVSYGTAWDWVDSGLIPAYRVGKGNWRIKRSDMEAKATKNGPVQT